MKNIRWARIAWISAIALGAGLLGWQFAGGKSDRSVPSTPPAAARSNGGNQIQTASDLTSPLEQQRLTTSATETPEMHNARIMAKFRKDFSQVAPVIAAFKGGGLDGLLAAQMEQWKPEYMTFLRSLGFSDQECSKIYDLVKQNQAFARAHRKEALDALAQGELGETDEELLRYESALESTMGTKNYQQLKYWEFTRQDRRHISGFEADLAKQSVKLSSEQQMAVVDALYQARKGKGTFDLNLPTVPLADKLAYIHTVTESTSAVLPKAMVDKLGLYLRSEAEKPLVPHSLQSLIPEKLKSRLMPQR